MMGFLLVTHPVKDYDKWKEVFDESEGFRREYGLLGGWITRDPVNQKTITVILFAQDLNQAEVFVNSTRLRDHMTRGGVLGEPEVRYLEEVQTVADVAHHMRK